MVARVFAKSTGGDKARATRKFRAGFWRWLPPLQPMPAERLEVVVSQTVVDPQRMKSDLFGFSCKLKKKLAR